MAKKHADACHSSNQHVLLSRAVILTLLQLLAWQHKRRPGRVRAGALCSLTASFMHVCVP